MRKRPTRERVSLEAPPPDTARLESFPHEKLGRGTPLWRVVRQGRNPWWFSSDGTGRFDLPPPEGTCYTAGDEISALLEVIGPDIEGGTVSESFLSNRSLRRLALPRAHRVANLTDRKARGFGVTAEIHTVIPYGLPQRWALALRRSGNEGVLYHIRHDPSFRGSGVGVFGKAGERKNWSRGRDIPVDEKLREKLSSECNVRVLPIPRESGLRVID